VTSWRPIGQWETSSSYTDHSQIVGELDSRGRVRCGVDGEGAGKGGWDVNSVLSQCPICTHKHHYK
jgi:hypothetical protein